MNFIILKLFFLKKKVITQNKNYGRWIEQKYIVNGNEETCEKKEVKLKMEIPDRRKSQKLKKKKKITSTSTTTQG